jgi:hypothetical protein
LTATTDNLPVAIASQEVDALIAIDAHIPVAREATQGFASIFCGLPP